MSLSSGGFNIRLAVRFHNYIYHTHTHMDHYQINNLNTTNINQIVKYQYNRYSKLLPWIIKTYCNNNNSNNS